jgi:hypothetical protein
MRAPRRRRKSCRELGARLRHALTGLAAALVAALALPVAADANPAGSATAAGGDVQATLTWKAAKYGVADPHLTVARAGAPAFDASPVAASKSCREGCFFAASGKRDSPLQVVDLDGDGEPEVLVDAFTGGAHCCAVTEILRFTGTGYEVAEREWGDPGYDVEDLDGDGRPEFVTADDAFAYAFTAYAFSFLPPKVLQWHAGTFTNATRRFPALVTADLSRLRKAMRSLRRHHYPTTGATAAYVADLYLLGRAKDARAHLSGASGGRPFKRSVLRFLHEHGYR